MFKVTELNNCIQIKTKVLDLKLKALQICRTNEHYKNAFDIDILTCLDLIIRGASPITLTTCFKWTCERFGEDYSGATLP